MIDEGAHWLYGAAVVAAMAMAAPAAAEAVANVATKVAERAVVAAAVMTAAVAAAVATANHVWVRSGHTITAGRNSSTRYHKYARVGVKSV